MVMKVIRKARNEGVRVERVIKMPLIHRPDGEGRTIMGAAFVVRVVREKVALSKSVFLECWLLRRDNVKGTSVTDTQLAY